jgi:hypothetical protein
VHYQSATALATTRPLAAADIALQLQMADSRADGQLARYRGGRLLFLRGSKMLVTGFWFVWRLFNALRLGLRFLSRCGALASLPFRTVEPFAVRRGEQVETVIHGYTDYPGLWMDTCGIAFCFVDAGREANLDALLLASFDADEPRLEQLPIPLPWARAFRVHAGDDLALPVIATDAERVIAHETQTPDEALGRER